MLMQHNIGRDEVN